MRALLLVDLQYVGYQFSCWFKILLLEKNPASFDDPVRPAKSIHDFPCQNFRRRRIQICSIICTIRFPSRRVFDE